MSGKILKHFSILRTGQIKEKLLQEIDVLE